MGRFACRSERQGLEDQRGGFARATGQCGKNAIVGSWLVFPHQGQCEDGQAVGDDGCTWKVTGFKVVEIQPCFNSTAAVLAAAFEAYQLDWQNAPFPHVMDYLKDRVAVCPDISSPTLV